MAKNLIDGPGDLGGGFLLPGGFNFGAGGDGVGGVNLGSGRGALGGAFFARGGTGGNFANKMKRLRREQVFSQIQDIINRRGATDPQRLALEQAGILRSGDTTAAQIAGGNEGIGQSGVVKALLAANAGGVRESLATAQARENALAEERQRQDILNLVLGPLDRRAGRKASIRAARAGAQAGGGAGLDIGGILGAIPGLIKAFGGGTGNKTTGGTGGAFDDQTGGVSLGGGSFAL